MTASDPLVEFIRARLDEDEERARSAKGNTAGEWTDWGVPGDIVLYDKSGKLTLGHRRHMTRHDPARVLRDVEAKRRILDDFESAARWADDPHCQNPPHYLVRAGVLLDALRLLASEWSDHPAYLEEWTP